MRGRGRRGGGGGGISAAAHEDCSCRCDERTLSRYDLVPDLFAEDVAMCRLALCACHRCGLQMKGRGGSLQCLGLASPPKTLCFACDRGSAAAPQTIQAGTGWPRHFGCVVCRAQTNVRRTCGRAPGFSELLCSPCEPQCPCQCDDGSSILSTREQFVADEATRGFTMCACRHCGPEVVPGQWWARQCLNKLWSFSLPRLPALPPDLVCRSCEVCSSDAPLEPVATQAGGGQRGGDDGSGRQCGGRRRQRDVRLADGYPLGGPGPEDTRRGRAAAQP